MAVSDANMFPGFLTPVLTQLFIPKPPTTFLTSFCRGERRKYAGKKSRLNRGSNSQPPGLESDTLTTEPSGQGFSVCITVDRNDHLQVVRNWNASYTNLAGLIRMLQPNGPTIVQIYV